MSQTLRSFSFSSTNKTSRIRGVVYLPPEEPKAILQIVHGMCEHKERYAEFARFLSQKGFVVCIHDHLGHGQSVGEKEVMGFFAHEDGWKCLIADCYRVTQQIQKAYPQLPLYLLGHSMGSFLARLYAARYPYALNGLILSGTGGKNTMAIPGILLCDQVMAVHGEYHISPTIDSMALGGNNKGFGGSPHPKAWLTRDMELAEKFLQDPACNFVFTTSAFKDLFTLHYLANKTSTFAQTRDDLPILLFSGDQDPIGRQGKGVKQVAERYQQSGNPNVTLVLYPQGRHEMLNEINRQSVYQDLEGWLSQHLPSHTINPSV